jgi:hypothetical protein
MPRPTLEQIRSLEGLAISHKWEFQVTKFPSVGSYPASEDLNLRCTIVGLPSLSIDDVDIMIRGLETGYPANGKVNKTYTISFIETEDMIVNTYIDALASAAFNQQTGVMAKKKEISGINTIFLLDSSNAKIYKFIFYGSRMSTFNRGNPTEGSNEPFKPSITFKYDYYEAKSV